MQVTLSMQFERDLQALAQLAQAWKAQAGRRTMQAHRRIGQLHRREAIERVPVDEGRLRNAILTNTYLVGDQYHTETGTNVEKYPAFVEFGTRYIAGGRVKALGQRVDITDAQAIKLWPAKNFGSLNLKTGGRKAGLIDEKSGRANLRVIEAIDKRLAAGRAQESMPWLRPSFQKIKAQAIEMLQAALEPPPSAQGAAG